MKLKEYIDKRIKSKLNEEFNETAFQKIIKGMIDNDNQKHQLLKQLVSFANELKPTWKTIPSEQQTDILNDINSIPLILRLSDEVKSVKKLLTPTKQTGKLTPEDLYFMVKDSKQFEKYKKGVQYNAIPLLTLSKGINIPTSKIQWVDNNQVAGRSRKMFINNGTVSISSKALGY